MQVKSLHADSIDALRPKLSKLRNPKAKVTNFQEKVAYIGLYWVFPQPYQVSHGCTALYLFSHILSIVQCYKCYATVVPTTVDSLQSRMNSNICMVDDVIICCPHKAYFGSNA